jgi:hypothetical protein
LQSAGLTSHPTFGGNSSYQCMGREEITILEDAENGSADRGARSAIVFTQGSPCEIRAGGLFARRFREPPPARGRAQ